jgi:hypothetical protein
MAVYTGSFVDGVDPGAADAGIADAAFDAGCVTNGQAGGAVEPHPFTPAMFHGPCCGRAVGLHSKESSVGLRQSCLASMWA